MKLTKILFWGILFIGLILRIYNLSSIPASLHFDEASIGYNAYSILTTGKDEHGVSLPFYFKAYGEYKSPIQIYSTIPLIFLFGLNEFSVRLTSAIYGVLGLIAIYLLTKELFKENKQADSIALLAMFFLAISPWDIHFSRIAWEMMPFVFFTAFGLFLFIKAQTVPKIFPLAVISFMLASYSYLVALLFIPIFGITLCIVYFHFFLSHKKDSVLGLFVLIFMLVPLFINIFLRHDISHWQEVNIFSNPPTKGTISQHIDINYFEHFSLDFLFTKGDIGMPGQISTYDSVRGMGELYLFQLPLLLLGLYYLIKKKTKNGLVLFFWLLLYPLGSMFTTTANPLARRSIIGVIPFQITSAFGMVCFLQILKKVKRFSLFITAATGLFITFSFVYYLFLYFINYPNYSSGHYGFQYGSKQIVAYFSTHENSYDDLYMSQYIYAPYMYFNFYAPHDCSKCKTGLPDTFYHPERKQLFAIPPYYMSSHREFIYTPFENIYYPDGSLAFVLTQIKEK